MAILNTGEPFGLPKGTVRGIIALVCLGLVVYDFVIDQRFTVELMAFAGPYLGFYFGTRSNEQYNVEDEPLAQPYTGDKGEDAV